MELCCLCDSCHHQPRISKSSLTAPKSSQHQDCAFYLGATWFLASGSLGPPPHAEPLYLLPRGTQQPVELIWAPASLYSFFPNTQLWSCALISLWLAAPQMIPGLGHTSLKLGPWTLSSASAQASPRQIEDPPPFFLSTSLGSTQALSLPPLPEFPRPL